MCVCVSLYQCIIRSSISLSCTTFLAAMAASLPWIVWIFLWLWLSLLSFQHTVHCWLEHGLVLPKRRTPGATSFDETWIYLWKSGEMRIVLILPSVIWWSLWCLEPLYQNPCQHRLKWPTKPIRLIKKVFSQASPKLSGLAGCTIGRGTQLITNFDATLARCHRHVRPITRVALEMWETAGIRWERLVMLDVPGIYVLL